MIGPGVAEITGYLQGAGWQRRPREWRGASIWYSGDAEVLVPARDGMGDGELRVREIVDVLSAVEARPREEIVHDIQVGPADTQRFTIFPMGLPSGFARLGQGIRMLQGVERALRAIARSVIEGPRRTFRGDPPDAVEKLMSRVEVGSASPGSYIVPVRVPLDRTADGEPPLGRQVTLGLRSAVSLLHNGSEAGEMVSAEVCEALGELGGESGESRFAVEFQWAAGSSPSVPPAKYEFAAGVAVDLRAAAERLRRLDEATTVTVTGLIRSLRLDLPQDDNWSIEVRSEVAVTGGNRRTVWVQLPDRETYEDAILAHRAERQVRIRGVLSDQGRQARLIADVTGFEVLAE